jgi:hypothetical protein
VPKLNLVTHVLEIANTFLRSTRSSEFDVSLPPLNDQEMFQKRWTVEFFCRRRGEMEEAILAFEENQFDLMTSDAGKVVIGFS